MEAGDHEPGTEGWVDLITKKGTGKTSKCDLDFR